MSEHIMVLCQKKKKKPLLCQLDGKYETIDQCLTIYIVPNENVSSCVIIDLWQNHNCLTSQNQKKSHYHYCFMKNRARNPSQENIILVMYSIANCPCQSGLP